MLGVDHMSPFLFVKKGSRFHQGSLAFLTNDDLAWFDVSLPVDTAPLFESREKRRKLKVTGGHLGVLRSGVSLRITQVRILRASVLGLRSST